MRVTNKYNLPAPFVKAASSFTSRPRPGKLSVTELCSPPQIRALKIKHWDDIEEDAADRVWALFGSAMHKILEEHAKGENVLAEEYVKMEVFGYEIRGVFDLLSEDTMSLEEGGILDDYKTCSYYAVKDGPKPEWVQQLNCYAAILRETAGIKVSQLRIIPLIRDHSRAQSLRDKDYPDKAVMPPMQIPLWDHEETMMFLRKRVFLHRKADELGEIPPCSDLERWATRPSYKVYKKSNLKRAIPGGVCETKEGAKQVIEIRCEKDAGKKGACNPDDFTIKFVEGESKRCAEFCSVSRWCMQWAKDPNNPKNKGGMVSWESTDE